MMLKSGLGENEGVVTQRITELLHNVFGVQGRHVNVSAER
jgi:hypothetical protein